MVYKKGMDKDCDIVAPSQLGGLKSPGYLALNPQGKMPLLVMPDGTSLPESEVIVSYLLDKYSGVGPSLRASTPELRARGALATRIHDIYIASIQVRHAFLLFATPCGRVAVCWSLASACWLIACTHACACRAITARAPRGCTWQTLHIGRCARQALPFCLHKVNEVRRRK